ncbi:MAG: lipopolysaccharide heptosyltransferase II, partial [Candidatus Omnitrophota bacterium]
NPYLAKLIIYDKYAPLKEKIKLFFDLAKERFDVVIDLRNTFFGMFLPARFRTSPFLGIPKNIIHMKDKNLYRLEKALKTKISLTNKKRFFYISPQNENYVNNLLEKNNINKNLDKIIIVAPVARGANRNWPRENFVKTLGVLSKDYKIIIVGTQADKEITKYIYKNCSNNVFDFSGLTNLAQLAALIEKSHLVIVCDTGVLQLASYINTPILALFGPSDEKKYGPWSKKNLVLGRELFCRRCHQAQCPFGTTECMELIKPQEVIEKTRYLIENNEEKIKKVWQGYFKRILVVRTDRIGDVILSTPVIKILRDSYPNAYIAMMVSPYAKDIVDGNPYLDEVIIYDKDKLHKSCLSSIKFALNLRKKHFSLALILHSTNRVNLITFFARIKERVGYNRKLGFLLTRKLEDRKHLGSKHELEYNLDLVRFLGIEPQEANLFMPINEDSERYVEELFNNQDIEKDNKLLVVHPGASCPSKIWPDTRFAQVADKLVEKYGFGVLIIGGPKDLNLAQNMLKNMKYEAVNLAGKTTISQLASVLRRCKLFISNDSGPVHIASAVGVPVISIFGRAQAGLSPKRWGPLGRKDKFLHKNIGCIECLAHNCVKRFRCLDAINVDDVVKVADEVLK